jgi:large subunit ribosomal protein L3
VNGLIGKKIGMTSFFVEDGRSIACTVVEASPNVVTQVKTYDSDGYDALQLAYGEAKEKNTTRPMAGHFEKAGTTPKRRLVEFRNMAIEKQLGEQVKL